MDLPSYRYFYVALLTAPRLMSDYEVTLVNDNSKSTLHQVRTLVRDPSFSRRLTCRSVCVLDLQRLSKVPSNAQFPGKNST